MRRRGGRTAPDSGKRSAGRQSGENSRPETVGSQDVRESQSRHSAELCPSLEATMEVVDRDREQGLAVELGSRAGFRGTACRGVARAIGPTADKGAGILRRDGRTAIDTNGKHVSIVQSPSRRSGSHAHKDLEGPSLADTLGVAAADRGQRQCARGPAVL